MSEKEKKAAIPAEGIVDEEPKKTEEEKKETFAEKVKRFMDKPAVKKTCKWIGRGLSLGAAFTLGWIGCAATTNMEVTEEKTVEALTEPEPEEDDETSDEAVE